MRLKKETEQSFLRAVVALASLYGWMVYFTYDSRHSPAGFPDLCLARPGALIFAELKTATGKVTSAQARWLDTLGNSAPGVIAEVWRPGDWPRIERLLQHGVSPCPRNP